MKEKEFNSKLGATTGCTARLSLNSQYCGDHESRDNAKKEKKAEVIYGDSWFGSKVKYPFKWLSLSM